MGLAPRQMTEEERRRAAERQQLSAAFAPVQRADLQPDYATRAADYATRTGQLPADFGAPLQQAAYDAGQRAVGAALSAVGQPVQQTQGAQPASLLDPAQRWRDVLPQPTAAPAQPAAPASTAQPTTEPNGYQNTSIPGVVARLGPDGVPEFSNIAGDVEGASGQFAMPGRAQRDGSAASYLAATPQLGGSMAAGGTQMASLLGQQQQGGLNVFTVGGEDRDLQELATSDNPFERRAAREALDRRTMLRNTQVQQAGALQQAALAGQMGIEQANINAEAQQAAALAGAQGRVSAAALRQQGQSEQALAIAQLEADAAAQRAAITGEYQLAVAGQQRAPTPLEALRASLAQQAAATGDVDTLRLALGEPAPQAPSYGTDMRTGAALTKEVADEYNRQALITARLRALELQR